MGAEGGHAIENSLAALRTLRRLGVRYMTLTHGDTIDWADSATDEARHGGLTSFGEELALRVQDILRSVDELGDLARASHERLVGRLRIGVIPTIAPYLLPRMIRDLTTRYPGVDLQVRETQTERLIAELLEGRLDTAVDIVGLTISLVLFWYGWVALADAFRLGSLIFKELVVPEWWLLTVIPAIFWRLRTGTWLDGSA